MKNNPESEKLTFLELINKYKKIEIPIIQRDYAQGREGKEELRKNFLKALFNAVKEDKPLELDFIYGSVKDDVLQPLDGQQRLTTLFLLHWYIAEKEGKIIDTVVEKQLKKFTYETRISSREFCEKLIEDGIDFTKLLETDYYEEDEAKPKNNELSKTIIDSPWFFLSWKKDPTIKSMLTMLDSIHQTFKNEIEVWDKLNNITFHYIELENFGLSDDLYIKMNARGKQLTAFENFKSKFEKYIKINKLEKQEGEFAKKIDTIWTDLFWKYRDADGLIDDKFLNFIAGIAMYNYALNYNDSSTEDKEEYEYRIAELIEDPTKVRPDDFKKEQDCDDLVDCLNLYSEQGNDKVKPEINLWNYLKSSTLFKDFITERLTYPMRVMFFAQTQYLKCIKENKKEFDQEKFNEWMRVIRNIVKNSDIDRPTKFISAIKLVEHLSDEDKVGCGDIYKSLLKVTENNKLKFGKNQVEHEKDKATIIESNVAYKKIIFRMEDLNFFKGDIDFALYCIDYDNTNVSSFDVEKLKNLQEIIKNELDDIDKPITDDFKRAFLTIKENDYYECWGSWSDSFKCPKRFLLNKNSDLVYFAKSDDWKKSYLRSLLLKRMEVNSFADIAANYSIPEGMPKWKEKLIKGTAKLDGASYILIPNDDTYCLLAWQQKPSRDDQVERINNN